MHVPAAFRTLLKNTAIIAMETKRLYQWAIAAALMMCLPMCISSCIPDDTPDKGNAIVCINTASLCEKLGIADLVAGMLAEKASFKITDSVLVYDRQGLLVARQGAESSSLQTVTIHLSDIPQGTYTLVAWQTSTSGPEPFWLLMEAEQLATAHIVQLYPSTISSCRAIGLYTTTVTIGSEAATVQAEVEPMGSVVDLIIDGLTPECDYGNVSLAVEGNGVQSSESQHRIQQGVS